MQGQHTISAVIISLMLTACASSTDDEEQTSWYKPTPGTTWQLQLSGDLNITHDATIYDIDLYDTPQSTIDALHNAGRKVICYFSAGSYEDWRTDAADFDAATLGNDLDGWPGERWLDIRQDSVRAIMLSRMDLAVTKKCDGVDPDNVNGYSNNTGFPLTADDQLDYNRFLAGAAHSRNLSIGLKNDLDQVPDLVSYFDFSVNEECYEYDECDLLQPFIDANKAVLNVEYADAYVNDSNTQQQLCQTANNAQFSTIIMPLLLDDSFRISC